MVYSTKSHFVKSVSFTVKTMATTRQDSFPFPKTSVTNSVPMQSILELSLWEWWNFEEVDGKKM